MILAEFSKTVALQDGILIRTEMDSLYPSCKQKGAKIMMDLRLRTTSLRPLENYHDPLKLHPSYFVAVIDKKGNVLSRTDHDLDVVFGEKQTTKVRFESIQEKIPSGKDVTVYVGFNLDQSQLTFLQQTRKRKTRGYRP